MCPFVSFHFHKVGAESRHCAEAALEDGMERQKTFKHMLNICVDTLCHAELDMANVVNRFVTHVFVFEMMSTCFLHVFVICLTHVMFLIDCVTCCSVLTLSQKPCKVLWFCSGQAFFDTRDWLRWFILLMLGFEMLCGRWGWKTGIKKHVF